jgi:hypothetical protein
MTTETRAELEAQKPPFKAPEPFPNESHSAYLTRLVGAI